MAQLESGTRHTRTLAVTDALTATAVGSGDVPVLATPAVLALAEGACVAVLDGYLEDGQTSVGTFAEVEHHSATPVGRTVTVEATLVDRDGRQLAFEVAVREAGEVVASVRHRRAIVDRQRFLEAVGATDA